MGMDPLTLAVVKAGLEQVAEEMDTTLTMTAFSPVISEGLDRANGIYDARTGEVIVQGATGLPIFIGTMQFTVQTVAKTVRELAPGDIVVVNDPYSGGTHVMDLKLVAPVFYEGQLFCFLANTGHWPDMGGASPGGFVPHATEVYQEGLRLPPVKLYRRGELIEDMLTVLLANIRIPEERLGDLRAQASALYVGERRLRELLDRFGMNTVQECVAELKARAEQQMRSHIAGIPDGVYSFSDCLDSDGIEDKPLMIRLEMTVKGADVTLDFSKTDPPCRGPLNSVVATTMSACYIAFKHVFPDTLINAGSFAPFHFIVPETTFLRATFPRPVSGCAAEVSQRVVDVVFGALAQAMPEALFGAPIGTSENLVIAGADPKRGPYVLYVYGGGGYGGFKEGDGLTHGAATIGSAKIPPMEVLEQNYPIRVRRFQLREGSAGGGEHRGGFGATYEFELLRGEAVVSWLGERGKFAPYGIRGGKPAKMTEFIVHRASGQYVSPHVSKDEKVPLRVGESVQLNTPGGGGYGDPFRRDPQLVLRDVTRGYVTREAADRDHGVVIRSNPWRVDEPATEARRRSL